MYFRAEILDAEEKVCGLLRLHPNISFHNLHFEKEESLSLFCHYNQKGNKEDDERSVKQVALCVDVFRIHFLHFVF